MRKNSVVKTKQLEDKNTKVVTVITPKSFLYHKHFNMGYADAEEGKGFRKEYDEFCTLEQTMYEHGRQYYYALKHEPTYKQHFNYFIPKNGKAVNPQAIEMLQYLAGIKSLICSS